MKDFLLPFITKEEETILSALKIIDLNKKGFLVILDKEGRAIGTLTDGDIRRAFIAGKKITEKIDKVYTQKFKFVKINDELTSVIDLFKSESVKFLPILDSNGKLVNIITKKQMHSLLLQDIHADLNYDFFSLDENIVEYEIFQRPWGFYKTTVLNEYFQSKVISVKPGQRLSLQSHNHREEHWIIAHGNGQIQIDQSFIDVKCGNSLFIPKGAKHRIINTDKKENLIITEVQIGDYFGEDDIIRYEDDYGRIKK